MPDFRALLADADGEIFDRLHDATLIDGISVQGFFAAPWYQPQIGQLKTAVVEPQLTVRDIDVVDVQRGAVITRLSDGSLYDVVSIEPDGTGVTNLILRPR
jgi:hypothetical protein